MSEDKIVLLDDITANQIAAGEVVERPLSVVKELCENSVDAGATAIKIEIENGGQTLIRVTDNGCGMSERDALMCLSRHATSKIRSSADLAGITTLGFRGEAVPSIASVSRMVIETCGDPEGKGTKITVTGGEVEAVESIAFSRGTRITVRELFFNVPARRKFMKTVSSEQTGIIDVVGRLALASPDIRFELLNLAPSAREKGALAPKRLMLSAAGGDLLNAVTSVFGSDTAREMVYFSEKDDICSVSGYVSSPGGCKSSRRDEYLFVNGRSVKNRKILYMAELPFKSLAPGRYPALALFITLPPSLVDVNVHPAKSEVNFSNEGHVSGLVYKGILKAVSGALGSVRTEIPSASAPAHSEKTAATSGYVLPKNISQEGSVSFVARPAADSDKDDPFEWTAPPAESAPIPVPKNLKVIGQYRNTYIICGSDEGIIIIDQHVAHERVLYEGFMSHTGDNTWSQLLLMPVTVSCSLKEASIVNARLEELAKAGFLLEDFGGGSFIMRGYPACLKENQAREVLEGIIREMSEEQGDKKLVIKPEKVLITASCRMAVKAGDPLSVAEMQALTDALLKCSIVNTCPHGRPIIMSVTNLDLDKAFGRL